MGQSQARPAVAGGQGEDGPTMRACLMERSGSIHALKWVDVPIPALEPGEIRIRVLSAGVNPGDVRRCMSPGGQFPCILGSEVAGVIHEVGDGVSGYQCGDRVWARMNTAKQYGGFAEYCVTEADSIAPMPIGLSFSQAAAVPCSGWTAYLALYYKLKVQEGESILIVGASGGVGSFAIQLAKLSGLKVYALTQAHKMNFAQSLGADATIPTSLDDQEVVKRLRELTGGSMVDHVLDTVSGASAAAAASLFLRVNGSLCSVAAPLAASGEEVLFSRALSLHYCNPEAMLNSGDRTTRGLISEIGTAIGPLFAAGQLKVPIMEECEFEQVVESLHTITEHQVQGKLVVNVVPPKGHAEAEASCQQGDPTAAGQEGQAQYAPVTQQAPPAQAAPAPHHPTPSPALEAPAQSGAHFNTAPAPAPQPAAEAAPSPPGSPTPAPRGWFF